MIFGFLPDPMDMDMELHCWHPQVSTMKEAVCLQEDRDLQSRRIRICNLDHNGIYSSGEALTGQA